MTEATKEPAGDLPVIGYSTGGQLIRGRHRAASGYRLVPFYPGEYAVIRMANTLDRKILGAGDDDAVVAVFEPGEDARRYLARNTSIRSIPSAAAVDDKLLDALMRERAAREGGNDE